MTRATRPPRPSAHRRPVVLLLVALALLASACDWSQYGYGPGHTGFNPGESGITPDTVSGVAAPTWTGVMDGGVGERSSPVVANGVVYISTRGGGLFAFAAVGTDGCTGDQVATPCQPLWSAPVGQENFSSPVVANGRVYLGSEDGNLYVFDAAGVEGCGGTPKICTPLWTDQLDFDPMSVSIATVANGRVYVGGGSPGLFVFSEDGTQGCSGSPKVCVALWVDDAGGSVEGAPTIAGGRVFVGSSDHNLYAFDANAAAPRPLWIGPTGGAIRTTAAASGTRVYAASDDGNLYAFATDGGSGCSGHAVCLPLWRAGIDDPGEASPALANGLVYMSGDTTMNAYDAAGVRGCTGTPATCTPLWTSRDIGDGPLASPVVAGSLVFVPFGDFHQSFGDGLAALDAHGTFNCSAGTCPPVWQSTSLAGIPRTPLAVANGWLYAADGAGNLVAFKLI